jgi:hypothetical protein
MRISCRGPGHGNGDIGDAGAQADCIISGASRIVVARICLGVSSKVQHKEGQTHQHPTSNPGQIYNGIQVHSCYRVRSSKHYDCRFCSRALSGTKSQLLISGGHNTPAF